MNILLILANVSVAIFILLGLITMVHGHACGKGWYKNESWLFYAVAIVCVQFIIINK